MRLPKYIQTEGYKYQVIRQEGSYYIARNSFGQVFRVLVSRAEKISKAEFTK